MENKRISIDELTGLRGVAALFILLNHTCLLLSKVQQSSISAALNCFGIMGMDLFFILSGFVIHYNYCHKLKEKPVSNIKKFLIARFSRLYPLYFLFIIGFFVYNFFNNFNNSELMSRDIATLPIFLSGTQSWFYSFINKFPVIYCQQNANISWSISTEFALYLFFIPLTLCVFNIKKIKHCFYLLFLMVIFNVIWLHSNMNGNFLVKFLDHFNYGIQDFYPPSTWLIFHSPLARIFQFISGCLISEILIKRKSLQNDKLFKIFQLIIIFGIFLFILFVNNISSEFRHIFSTILLTGLVLSVTLGGNNFLKSKIPVLFGEISYSTYLLHIIFVMVFHYTGSHTISYILNFAGFIICTYVTAYFVYNYYEMPARKKVREFLNIS